MEREKFNMVYLTSLSSRPDIGIGNVLMKWEEMKNEQLDELVDSVKWYGLGLFLAICPVQELNELSSYFYKKYTEEINVSIEKKIQESKEMLNVIYLRLHKEIYLTAIEIEGEISISDLMETLKKYKPVLFLAVCCDGEVDGLLDYFREKYRSYEIEEIVRYETKRRRQ